MKYKCLHDVWKTFCCTSKRGCFCSEESRWWVLTWLILGGKSSQCECVWLLGVCFHASLPTDKLPQRDRVRPPQRPDRPLSAEHHCWLAWDSWLGATGHTERMWSQTNATPLSVLPRNGGDYELIPPGLRGMQPQRGSEEERQTESHTCVFTERERCSSSVMGCSLRCCSGI